MFEFTIWHHLRVSLGLVEISDDPRRSVRGSPLMPNKKLLEQENLLAPSSERESSCNANCSCSDNDYWQFWIIHLSCSVSSFVIFVFIRSFHALKYTISSAPAQTGQIFLSAFNSKLQDVIFEYFLLDFNRIADFFRKFETFKLKVFGVLYNWNQRRTRAY